MWKETIESAWKCLIYMQTSNMTHPDMKIRPFYAHTTNCKTKSISQTFELQCKMPSKPCSFHVWTAFMCLQLEFFCLPTLLETKCIYPFQKSMLHSLLEHLPTFKPPIHMQTNVNVTSRHEKYTNRSPEFLIARPPQCKMPSFMNPDSFHV
jgi:hypothetical protein